ncbi:MAG: urease accessory protein UreD [Alkalinema sp. RU_4_3]|nr:urease accessory protein UreD [Alkalinema sp. RU_4_3]
MADLSPPPLPNTPWQGSLDLKFAADRTRVTKLTHCESVAPYKVQRAFPCTDGTSQVVLLHTAGGMVSGDRLNLTAQLAPKAQALLTTAAAGKVYRATEDKTTFQTATIHLAENARLEWLPQETILFDQARFHQSLRINLGAGAQVLLWDVVRLGRTAHGESFLEGMWRSHTEVWQDGRPLWIDRSCLRASPELWEGAEGLGGRAIVGTLVWIGGGIDQEGFEGLRGLDQWPGSCGGMTRLPYGMVCRYRGSSSTEVRRWFVQVWRHIRGELWHCPLETPRIWMM